MTIQLVRNGKPLAVLVAKKSNPQACYAARELRYYLGMMTGVPFEIVDPKAVPPGMSSILLNQRVDRKLGEDGFRLKTEGTRLTVTGGMRGVIYGAYEVLERLGCRFFTPQDEKIPVNKSLKLPDFDEMQVPILEYRFHNTEDLERRHRFAVKSRINGGNIPDFMGGGLRYSLFVHSMDYLVPQRDYGKTHPEYFSMVNGKRYIPENAQCGQRCLTNPDVLKIATERVRANLLAHPECRLVSISQMDNGAQCTCPKCRKSDLEEGSPAGTMLKFVNQIATALKKEFPNVIFDTLAYLYTRPAPKKTKPADNVCVRLCSIECCFSHPMEQCDDTTRGVEHPDGSHSDFVTDLQNWGRVCNRMYIWDYVTCFSHYPTPHPNWHTLQPNLQTFVKNHVKGVFEQGNSKVGGGPDLVELRQYLLGKLLWNPYCDVQRHIREFTDYYYGAAAKFVRRYMDAVCEKCERDNIHVGFNDAPVNGFVSERMLDCYDAILDKAENAVKGDPVLWMRVRRIRFCTSYLRLKQKAMLEGKWDAAELNAFFTEWRRYGYNRIHEWVDADLAHYAFLTGHWRGEELLHHWTEEAGEIL